jgi:hypothetical protein
LNSFKIILITGVFLQALSINDIEAKSCDSADGVNLTAPGKAFSGIMPRDQGRLGLCFSYAATDLLRSHTGANSPFNVFDAAVNTDEDVDGGDPGSVMKSLIERGWACTDTYKFQNMFPSSEKNILTELEELSIDMPVFYTGNLTTGEARQQRIAEKAAALSGKGGCELWNGANAVDQEIHKLYDDIDKLNAKVSKLRNELNMLDWGWVNYLSGSRDNSEIQKDIKKVSAQRNEKEKKVESLEKKQDKYEKRIQGKNNLDQYSEDDAAEIVYYWAKKTYPKMKEIFLKYGVDSKYIPSFERFITERVKKDPVHGFAYAGRMYGYKIMKQVLSNSCLPPNQQPIRKNIKTRELSLKNSSEGTERIQELLEKNNPQGSIISIHSSYLTSGTWNSEAQDYHAVVIVGCRTVNGQKQFLIHNSWGSGCGNIYKNFTCSGGRTWVPAAAAVQASREVQWLEN